jgi:N-acetylmuramoyl-L-alanine amidase
VLDMKRAGQHKVFLLRDPHRLVVDVYRMGEAVASPAQKAASKTSPSTPRRIRKIVLDPGHGGKDPGALGPDGIREKDIVLSIAKKLARRLRRDMGVEVVLTRSRDVFIPLEDRTALANAEQADLFISLHSNASRNHRSGGLETYYLDNTTDEAAIRLAARENSTSRRNITDLQFILSDLVQNSKLADSVSLANHLQSSLVRSTRRRYREAKDLGVKKGLFYVLVGARMPAVLAELFFVTNRVEARSLKDRSFQNEIVNGLYEGIREYNRQLLFVKNL